MALVCPLAFVSYYNGMYLYYAERCSDHLYTGLTSATPLQVTNCPGSPQLCQDDGTLRVAGIGDPVFFGDTADVGALDFLSPKEPFPEQAGTVDQLDQNDCIFNDDQGAQHICRIFLIRVRAKNTLYLRIGFELRPGDVPLPMTMLQNIQRLGAKTFRGEFGQIPFVIFLPR